MKPAVSGVAKVGLPSNKCCNSWLAWVPRKLTHARTWYRIVHVKTAFSSRPINRQGYILLVTRLLDQHLAKDRSATTPKPLGIAHARSAPNPRYPIIAIYLTPGPTRPPADFRKSKLWLIVPAAYMPGTPATSKAKNPKPISANAKSTCLPWWNPCESCWDVLSIWGYLSRHSTQTPIRSRASVAPLLSHLCACLPHPSL